MRPVPISLSFVALALIAAGGDASAQTRSGREPTPLETLTAANSAARQRPRPEAFQEARQIYAYEPGALYEVYTSPNYVTTVLLEPGETLNTIAAGDTSRWMVTQADAEDQIEGRTIVLIKPQASNLRTNVVLITDRRSYLIEAVSQSGNIYSAQIAWTYRQAAGGADAAPIDAINLNYRIRTVRGRRPVWAPTRVFDDGRRTWIEFAPAAAASDLPPLFAITGEGAELVNYRVLDGPSGKRYMVDRVFDVGELRLGARNPIVVRLERNPADPPRHDRGTPHR
jgi:type IV secretion system protein VirB9